MLTYHIVPVRTEMIIKKLLIQSIDEISVTHLTLHLQGRQRYAAFFGATQLLS